MSVRIGTRPSLLDIAAQLLVTDPAASLADVAQAAGIGRTTLHKHYPTRDDLIRAVGHRAIDLWEQAIDSVPDGPDGGVRALIQAMIPIGPQLTFLWRTPAFDHDTEICRRWKAVESRGCEILTRAQKLGVLADGVPSWWLLQTLYSLTYVGAECVQSGHLAPRDAPELVLGTFLHGIGGKS